MNTPMNTQPRSRALLAGSPGAGRGRSHPQSSLLTGSPGAGRGRSQAARSGARQHP